MRRLNEGHVHFLCVIFFWGWVGAMLQMLGQKGGGQREGDERGG